MNQLKNPIELLSNCYNWMKENVVVECHRYEHGQVVDDGKVRFKAPADEELRVLAMFPQLWGSTATGFPGIGCQALTNAYSIVIECDLKYYVFFNGQFAYRVRPGCYIQTFLDDVKNCRLVAVRNAEGRYGCI